ncbi:hypothetical protein CCACVL1_16145 [Corchorus capsularis]|uniref:Uncharacterized protein n=1 Tax=Corchorus capsularis TaxID=210143 RepID=A0A1R3HYU1_COCAP|nr:hypothetical protein CCACVL1_16145 [Corchorus capsularis]
MEDYSINSCIEKSVASPQGRTTRRNIPDIEEEEEESGWTSYFEDFDNYQQQQQNSYCSSFSCSSSLISDAATTGAAWKLSTNNNIPVFACSSTPKTPNKLRFKKTRTKEISQEDDSLEDTASSPVNSPKVSELMKMNDMNPRKREDHHQIHSSQQGMKKGGGSENYSEIQIEQHEQDDERRMNFGDDHGCTELKKRGLCLVPFSMLVNYLG